MKSAVVARRRAVSPIGLTVFSHLGLISSSASREAIASAGSYQPSWEQPRPPAGTSHRGVRAHRAHRRRREGAALARGKRSVQAMTRVAGDILTDPPAPEADEQNRPTAPTRSSSPTSATPREDALAVMLHGGAWRAAYDLNHSGRSASALRDAGVATFNVEYRRTGNAGGGWPGTFEDILLAVEYARTRAPPTRARRLFRGRPPRAARRPRACTCPLSLSPRWSDPGAWDNDAVEAFFVPGSRRSRHRRSLQSPLGVPCRARARDARRRGSVRPIRALRRRRRRNADRGARRCRPLRADRPSLSRVIGRDRGDTPLAGVDG